MQTVTIFTFIILASFSISLIFVNQRNSKKHDARVKLLNKVIIALTAGEKNLESKLKLSAELNENLKKSKIKLMHSVNELQHELFSILSQKNT